MGDSTGSLLEAAHRDSLDLCLYPITLAELEFVAGTPRYPRQHPLFTHSQAQQPGRALRVLDLVDRRAQNIQNRRLRGLAAAQADVAGPDAQSQRRTGAGMVAGHAELAA